MAAMTAMPATIGGRYRVLRELGRGGFGAVYVVEHVHTGAQMALKVLHAQAGANPQVVERFKREARASARIQSEHVVKITDADAAPELQGAPFLVMELLDGCDLEKYQEQRGPLPPNEVVALLAQAARALDKAHSLGIVHRDLKPENLFLHRREDGSTILKILDFGISKMLGEASGEPQSQGLTSTGAVMGTPLYMAPEQARGMASQIAPATDVWSLGLIAYKLLTGRVYWQAETVADLLVQIIAAPMAPPSSTFAQLGPAFDAWFARSCERDRTKRFATVGEQVNALAQALGVPMQSIAPVSVVPYVAPIASSAAVALTPPGSGGGTGAEATGPTVGINTTGVASLAHTAGRNASKKTSNTALIAAFVGAIAVIGVGGLLVVRLATHNGESTPVASSPVVASTPAPVVTPPVPSTPASPEVSVAAAPPASASAAPTAARPLAGGRTKAPAATKADPPKVEPVAAPPPNADTPKPAAKPKHFDPDAP